MYKRQVKGVKGVHALHVLQFAAVISCVMCMMTKGSEKCIENYLGMFPFLPCAPSTAVSWLDACVAIASRTVASLEHLLHLVISVSLRGTVKSVHF